MADAIRGRHALAGEAAAEAAVREPAGPAGAIRIRLLPDAGMIVLRVHPGDAAVMPAIEAALGGRLPQAPNTTASAREGTLCWLGPDEWLWLGAAATAPTLLPAVEAATSGAAALALDIGAGRACFEVAGTRAIDVLRKGCPLDLHPREFGAGRCARTLLARSAAMILCDEPDARYRVIVDRSLAVHTRDWLAHAAREFQAHPR